MIYDDPVLQGFFQMFLFTQGKKEKKPEPNIDILKDAVRDLCQMVTQKTAGQTSKAGGKYSKKDLSWDNLERVEFTIVCEAVILVLSGKLDKLEG